VPVAVHAQTRWALKETLRIGGAESGPTSFSSIRSIAVDAKGQIFVLERQTQDIKVFDADGKHLRTIGRIGSGPGEMRNAEGMTSDRQGRLWVRDAANARFTVFNGEGELEKSWTMKFCSSQGQWYPQIDRQGRVLDVDCVVPQGADRAMGFAIVAYRPDFSGVDTLSMRPECGSRELSEAATWVRRSEKATAYIGVPYAPRPVTTLGPTGEIWCAPNNSRYEVLRLDPGARDTLRISRNLAAVPVTKAERDSVIAPFEKNGPSGFDYGKIPRTKPIVELISIDDQGRAWLRRKTSQGVVEFDVFSPAGQMLAIAMLGKYRLLPAPYVFRGDDVYMVALDDDDVQHVVRLHVERR
jgi:hypothetical protein